MRKVISYSLLMAAVLCVCACGLTKKDLGFSRQGPDETLVRTNAPLVLPPEYSVRPSKAEMAEEEELSYTDNDEDNE